MSLLPGTHTALAPVPPASARLEAHYHREQEAEFNASLQEYYAARARHQAEQQRLNQVGAAAAVAGRMGGLLGMGRRVRGSLVRGRAAHGQTSARIASEGTCITTGSQLLALPL